MSRLQAAEITQIAAIFPVLRRLAGDPRAAWLLGRPGLVDLLLRAGAAGNLPAGPLCEADVFAAVWGGLVRRDEVREPGGPTSDARERALIALARRRLLPGDPGEPPDAMALPALRSDGLLRPVGATSAWTRGDDFSSDLVADLAIARLLITGGWELLSRSGAPRWALRAARLACQALIIDAGTGSEQARAELHAAFDRVADRGGARWADVPDEALLTIGAGRQTLAAAWPALLASDRAGLRRLLRLAAQRYVVGGVGEVSVLEALPELAYCGGDDLGQDGTWDRHGTGDQIRRLVSAWLRGLIAARSGPDALRRRVCDRILDRSPETHDEFAIEALATLGPDLDDRAEAFLRAVPGGHLEPAVELDGPTAALAAYQPGLLATLAASYYLMGPPEYLGMLGYREGIRSHHAVTPMAAWSYGPFFRLLCVRPADVLALINLLLDHAATIRVGTIPPPGAETPGLDLDLPGVGVRRCAGDRGTWRWYGGGTNAPPPCLSALLAVEKWADHLLDVLKVPASAVIELMMRDCHNLAMPGLAAGLLVRHPEFAGSQLDRWLARPELWGLEVERAFEERPGTMHVQGPDPDDLHGRARRSMDFSGLAAEMTVQAGLDGDDERLATLAAVGDELVRWVQGMVAGREDAGEQVAIAQRWAAMLRPENHHPVQSEDGITFAFRYPDDAGDNLTTLESEGILLRLQLTYTIPTIWDAPTDTLVADLEAAREFTAASYPGPMHPADPIAAVAAAAIAAHARGRPAVPDEDLRWAAGVLVEAATHPWDGASRTPESKYRMAADRSAAAALPALLLPEFDHIRPSMSALEDALHRFGASVADEVRMIFAHGAAPVWAAPCGPGGSTCRHQVLWAAVLGGLRDCQLGAWDQGAQRRLIEPLAAPFSQALAGVQTERLLVNRLTSPLIAAADASRSGSCVARGAGRILGILLKAQARGGACTGRRGITARLARTGTARQSPASWQRWPLRAVHSPSKGTYGSSSVKARPPLPSCSATWRSRSPTTPALDLADFDRKGIEHARKSWPAPDAFSDLIRRWIPIAQGHPDQAGLVRAASLAGQHRPAVDRRSHRERLLGSRGPLLLPDPMARRHPRRTARWSSHSTLAAHSRRPRRRRRQPRRPDPASRGITCQAHNPFTI